MVCGSPVGHRRSQVRARRVRQHAWRATRAAAAGPLPRRSAGLLGAHGDGDGVESAPAAQGGASAVPDGDDPQRREPQETASGSRHRAEEGGGPSCTACARQSGRPTPPPALPGRSKSRRRISAARNGITTGPSNGGRPGAGRQDRCCRDERPRLETGPAMPVARTAPAPFPRCVPAHIAPGAALYPDEHRGEIGLHNPEAVTHSVRESVRDQGHTNGIASLWALLKRGSMGTDPRMSPPPLHRSVPEFAGRQNGRSLDTSAQMAALAGGRDGKRLRYWALIAPSYPGRVATSGHRASIHRSAETAGRSPADLVPARLPAGARRHAPRAGQKSCVRGQG